MITAAVGDATAGTDPGRLPGGTVSSRCVGSSLCGVFSSRAAVFIPVARAPPPCASARALSPLAWPSSVGTFNFSPVSTATRFTMASVIASLTLVGVSCSGARYEFITVVRFVLNSPP